MPTFDTQEPITATVELVVGTVWITASDRTDTVVEVRPADEAKTDDVKAAEQTTVHCADGVLLVKGPKRWQRFSPSGDGGSIEISIALPAGSSLDGHATMADFGSEGRLGECSVRCSAGGIRLAHTGPARLRTTGRIVLDRATGRTEVTTASGAVRIGTVDGPLVVKNSNGTTTVDEVTGDLVVKAANGDIAVRRTHAAVDARTANGDVRIGEVAAGQVRLESAAGELEVGVRSGTAAWLDLTAPAGRVHNSLDPAEQPGPDADVVEIRARAYFGDILVGRV